MHSSAALECAACVCFFMKLWVWEKNPLKICETVRNEEPAVREWEGQRNRATHGEIVRVGKSVQVYM